ncbi:MAG: aspartyl protease family protein [Planctomycetes bacterium]|nr:aspartyl protease family protein [Planctomycetota bacterium]
MKRAFRSLFVLALLACLLAPATLTNAQEKPAEPKAEPKAETKKDPNQVTFDFEFEGLMFVQTKVNGKGPYKFLFDSGATQSVLNARLARELELKLHDSPGGVQGVGEAKDVKMVVLDSMDIGGFAKGKTVAASMDLDHMSGTMGYHMMGIIGQNVIKLMKKIEIDFSTSKITATKWGDREAGKPQDQDEMLARMLEGGGMGGIPGMPRLPGMPGGPDDDEKDPGKDDDFSFAPAMGAYLMPGTRTSGAQFFQDERKTEAAPAQVTEGMTLDYTTVSVPMLGDLVPYWYVTGTINGQERTFMFDTGASMLLALGTEMSTEMKLPTSFSYPVKGIGKGEAKSGMVDSIKFGNLTVTDTPATIMDLPKMSDQMPDMIKQLLPMLGNRIKLDFDGIVGVTLATRYKKMIVNSKAKDIEFVPYAKGEVNKLNPSRGEEYMRDAVVRTWNGKAGKIGLNGDSVKLDDWAAHGLKSGGLMVESVEADGPAAKAGIAKGDIITHLVGEADLPEMEDTKAEDGDTEIRDMPGLIIWGCMKDPGYEATLRIKRGDKVMDVKVKLGDYGFKGEFPERFKQKK